MEKNINVAEILNGKPVNTKLWSPLFGDVYTSSICSEDTIIIVNHHAKSSSFYNNGKYFNHAEAEPLLFPSKEMRDWRKFAWKKGDVLISNDGKKEVFFNGFTDDTYALFKAKYGFEVLSDGNTIYLANEDGIATSDYTLEDKDVAQTYINTIEERLGGKLNRETLEIEKTHPKFKDGDIVALVVRKCTHIAIFQSRQGAYIGFHAVLCQNDELLLEEPFREDVGDIELRLATDSEKQQLFEALAKESKQWDAGKKMIIDLKQKVELKPFDKVLVRHQKTEEWSANIFSHTDKTDEYLDYVCVNGRWEFCIPYEGNESLLGTTKDVEDRYD